MHDVFISYENKSKNVADAICSTLERNKIRCWYAPRDVARGVPYARAIIEAINTCKAFVLVLNEHASKSDHVLNEVEAAYKRMSGDGMRIIPFKTGGDISQEMDYYVKRIHWIDAMTSSLEESMDDLLKNLADLVVPAPSKVTERKKNDYVDGADKKEAERLMAQTRVLTYFTSEVYEKIVRCKKNLSVLDIGSNLGDQVICAFGSREEVSKIIGIEISKSTTEKANEIYEGSKAKFYNLDCESEDFESDVREIMRENGIISFDIVNMSQVIHHLKAPFKAVKVARKILSKDGNIVAIDIDDGLHLAHPDPDGNFAKVVKIISESKTAGYRYSGREIFSLLKKAGLKDVTLEKNGINTVGLPIDIKEDLFKTYIELAPILLRESIGAYPDDEKFVSDQIWMSNVIDDMEQVFMCDDFMMTVGFMVYTAK